MRHGYTDGMIGERHTYLGAYQKLNKLPSIEENKQKLEKLGQRVGNK